MCKQENLVEGLDVDVDEDLVRKAKVHKEVTDDLRETFVRKNHDYGDSFSETFDELGEISALTRICDKINRLKSITTKEDSAVDDERKVDTIMDTANYLIMWAMELREDD